MVVDAGVPPLKRTVTPLIGSKDMLAPARSGGALSVGCRVQLLPSQVHVSDSIAGQDSRQPENSTTC